MSGKTQNYSLFLYKKIMVNIKTYMSSGVRCVSESKYPPCEVSSPSGQDKFKYVEINTQGSSIPDDGNYYPITTFGITSTQGVADVEIPNLSPTAVVATKDGTYHITVSATFEDNSMGDRFMRLRGPVVPGSGSTVSTYNSMPGGSEITCDDCYVLKEGDSVQVELKQSGTETTLSVESAWIRVVQIE